MPSWLGLFKSVLHFLSQPFYNLNHGHKQIWLQKYSFLHLCCIIFKGTNFFLKYLKMDLKWTENDTKMDPKWAFLDILTHIFFLFRSFIFPILMKPGSKSPFLPTLMAFFFCFFNGFLQVHTLIYDKNKGTNSGPEIYATLTFSLGKIFLISEAKKNLSGSIKIIA